MTATHMGMLDAADAALAELDCYGVWRPTQREAIMQVGGAILRTLRKQYGCDSLEYLDDELVYAAYLNETARVVHGWPETQDLIAPMTFFGTAHLLRKYFHKRGWAALPRPLPAGMLPSLIDTYPAVAVVDTDGVRYLSNAALRLLGYVSAKSFISTGSLAFTPASYLCITRDIERLFLQGQDIVDQVYQLVPGPGAIRIVRAWLLYDDDANMLGAMCALDRALTQASVPVTASPTTAHPIPRERGRLRALSRQLRMRSEMLLMAVVAAAILSAAPQTARMEEADEIVEEAAASTVGSAAPPAAIFDCNGDGHPEEYVAGGTGTSMLLRSELVDGVPRLTRVPSAATDITGVIGAYALDWDGDGITDIVALRAGRPAMLHGLGNCQFEEFDAD